MKVNKKRKALVNYKDENVWLMQALALLNGDKTYDCLNKLSKE